MILQHPSSFDLSTGSFLKPKVLGGTGKFFANFIILALMSNTSNVLHMGRTPYCLNWRQPTVVKFDSNAPKEKTETLVLTE